LNREGGKGEVTLSTVSYQSAGKVADMLIGLRQDDDMSDSNEMELLLLKYRDGQKWTRKPVQLRWELERMNIHEMGHAEWFPMRKQIGASKNRQLNVSEIVHDRKNPWTAKAKIGSSGNSKGAFAAIRR